MDMDSSSSNMTSVMMVPYLHFAGGDYLIFKSLSPTSPGAIAGASIVLFLFALLERALAAFRGYLEAYWSKRAQLLNSQDESRLASSSAQYLLKPRGAHVGATPTYRIFPPFTPSHDIPRGFIHAVQVFLGYGLMLAVMTFQAAYIIAIIIGLGVGEMMFGRYAAVGRHTGH